MLICLEATIRPAYSGRGQMIRPAYCFVRSRKTSSALEMISIFSCTTSEYIMLRISGGNFDQPRSAILKFGYLVEAGGVKY